IQAAHQRQRKRTSPMVQRWFDSPPGNPSTVRGIKIKEYPEMTDQPKINSQADALASYHITDEMLSKCELIQNASTNKYFVLVESANEQGSIYRVEYDREKKCLRCLPHTGTPCKAQ